MYYICCRLRYAGTPIVLLSATRCRVDLPANQCRGCSPRRGSLADRNREAPVIPNYIPGTIESDGGMLQQY